MTFAKLPSVVQTVSGGGEALIQTWGWVGGGVGWGGEKFPFLLLVLLAGPTIKMIRQINRRNRVN